MHSIDYNLGLLEAMLDEIEEFLLSADIFWPLAKRPKPGLPPYPRLCAGGLLLSLDESLSQVAQMDRKQELRHTKLQRHWDAILCKWRSAFERKSEPEMEMRLNLWRAYLSDLEEGSAAQFDYHREVRNRVQFTRLQTLAGESSMTHGLVDRMRQQDVRLLSLTISSEFIWDHRLREIYPVEQYGYLYRRPRGSRE